MAVTSKYYSGSEKAHAEHHEEEHDPRAELVRRLLEYEQMKLAGEKLNALPQAGRDFAVVQVLFEQVAAARLPEVRT